jgi:hypothetical protein
MMRMLFALVLMLASCGFGRSESYGETCLETDDPDAGMRYDSAEDWHQVTRGVRAICGDLFVTLSGEELSHTYRDLEYVTGSIYLSVTGGEIPADYFPRLRFVGRLFRTEGDATNTHMEPPARLRSVGAIHMGSFSELRSIRIEMPVAELEVSFAPLLERVEIRAPTTSLELAYLPELRSLIFLDETPLLTIDSVFLRDVPLRRISPALDRIVAIADGLGIDDDSNLDEGRVLFANLLHLGGYLRVSPCSMLRLGTLAPNLHSFHGELLNAWCVSERTFPHLRQAQLECESGGWYHGGGAARKGRNILLARNSQFLSLGCDWASDDRTEREIDCFGGRTTSDPSSPPPR